MSEAPGGLGVVDPIRVPAPIERLVDRLRDLPRLAQVFIGLAILDAIARTIGVIEPRASLSGDLVGTFASYVPRAALIVLPAVVLARRPSAPVDTPWVLRGAVFIALVTLLATPTLAWAIDTLGGLFPSGPEEGPIRLFSFAWALAWALAWVAVARGLQSLNPRPPVPFAAGLANLIALSVVGTTVLDLLASTIAWSSRGGEIDASVVVTTSIANILGQIAVAYLLRTAVRGLDDPNRPRRATIVASWAAVLWAFALLTGSIFGLVAAVDIDVAMAVPQWFSVSIALIADLATLLFVIAFGLGLADPSRPMPAAWEAASS